MNITANDIMSEHVVVVQEERLIRQVAHLMLRDRVSVFPVVDVNNALVGIITITDLFIIINKATQFSSRVHFVNVISKIKNRKVGEVMSKDVVTITPGTTLFEILSLIGKLNIHAFPVMEDNKMVGIVSRHDILNAIYAFD